MAQFNYARLQDTAKRLIARFGQTGTLRRTTDDGDPFNPGGQVTTDHACTFAVLDYAKKDVDGTLTRQTDQMVYLSVTGLSITPETTDQLIVGGAVMTIINVKPLSPAGTVLFYELQVRK
jgi:hypothetical protein